MLMNILTGVLCLIAVIIIGISTQITGKTEGGAGGAFGGGASDTYFNKGGAKGKDYRLQMAMKVCCVLLVILAIAMALLQKYL